jgi:hypothetical protein
MAAGRKTGGRQRGTPNKATAEVKVLAGQYGPEAIDTLVELMRSGQNEQTRRAACSELLDRAYGKATQSFSGDVEQEPLRIVIDDRWQRDQDHSRSNG